MTFLLVAQIIVSILLITLVMLQSGTASLGSSFGVIQSGYHTKQGGEKVVYLATIITGALFIVLSLLNIIFIS